MSANYSDYYEPDALPTHYRDDDDNVCSCSGTGGMAEGCPVALGPVHYSTTASRLRGVDA